MIRFFWLALLQMRLLEAIKIYTSGNIMETPGSRYFYYHHFTRPLKKLDIWQVIGTDDEQRMQDRTGFPGGPDSPSPCFPIYTASPLNRLGGHLLQPRSWVSGGRWAHSLIMCVRKSFTLNCKQHQSFRQVQNDKASSTISNFEKAFLLLEPLLGCYEYFIVHDNMGVHFW